MTQSKKIKEDVPKKMTFKVETLKMKKDRRKRDMSWDRDVHFQGKEDNHRGDKSISDEGHQDMTPVTMWKAPAGYCGANGVAGGHGRVSARST